MPLVIDFTKMSGAGNDFVVIDGRTGPVLDLDKPSLARALCAAHTGIGGDGMLVLEPSRKADFRMLYFNADGSHGGMCGNGGRCIAKYAWLRGLARQEMKFEALDTLYAASVEVEKVSLTMKEPTGLRLNLRIGVGNCQMVCHAIDTGAPHAVLFVESIEDIDVTRLGRAIRNHEKFRPAGTNVNFVTEVGEGRLELRTYERGVEAETLACGTGSVAAALIYVLQRSRSFPVFVRVRSGEWLEVRGRVEGQHVDQIVLVGPARVTFEGRLTYDADRREIVEEIVPNFLVSKGKP